MQPIIIHGAGGLGREILALMQDINQGTPRWNILGFTDDAIETGSLVSGLPILGNTDFLQSYPSPVGIVLAVANPALKAALYSKLRLNPLISFPTVIHSSSCIEPGAQIGEGCLITRFCFISVGACLGKNIFINVGSQVGHDTVIGDFTSIMPSVNLSGNVRIGKRCLIGVQSAVLQGLSVGDDVTVGIGSIVLQNVPENCTVMGYPARIVRV